MAGDSATLTTTATGAPESASPGSAPGAVATQRAQTYAERKAQAMADLDSDNFFEALGETADKGSTPERAPETDAKETAPPPAKASTDATGVEHGPDDEATDRPAAKAQPDTAANNARRAQRDPQQNPEAAYRAEVERLNRLTAELTEKLNRSDGDNRTLWEATERMKQIARETGAVAFSEIDDATRAAIVNQNAMRQQAEQAAHQQQAQQRWYAQAWEREVADRNVYGRASRSDAITDVYAAISEAGLKVAKDAVVKEFNAGYEADALVKAEIEMWMSDQTPAQLARKHIDLAMKRNGERVVQHFTTKAVDALRDQHQDPPRYDRAQAYGGASNGAPLPRENRRDIPYQERARIARQDFADSVEEDIRRLTA